jgi:ABC-type transport system involved in multi-copper enzyme maturation permease subunit
MWSVFRKSLRDSRWGLLWLSLALAGYAVLVMSLFPSIVEQAEDVNKLIEQYPPEIMAFIGYSADASTIDLAEPGGYLQSQFIIWLVLIVGALVIAQAFNSVTNAERDGTLDVMLSLPMRRRTYLVGRYLYTLTYILLVLTACFAAFVLSMMLFPEFDLPLGELALAVYGAALPLALTASFAYLLAVLLPSRHRFGGPLAYLFLFGSYLFHSLSMAFEALKNLRPLFFFEYYSARIVVVEGVRWADWALLGALILLYGFIAWWRIDAKELGT